MVCARVPLIWLPWRKQKRCVCYTTNFLKVKKCKLVSRWDNVLDLLGEFPLNSPQDVVISVLFFNLSYIVCQSDSKVVIDLTSPDVDRLIDTATQHNIDKDSIVIISSDSDRETLHEGNSLSFQ